jgi:hypothetical protein
VLLVKTSIQPLGQGLRGTPWAMAVLNYSPERRSAFWQFAKANSLPYIRVGPRKILFSEPAVMDWLARRSSTGRVT